MIHHEDRFKEIVEFYKLSYLRFTLKSTENFCFNISGKIAFLRSLMVKKSKDYILSMYGLPGVLLEIKCSPFNHGEITLKKILLLFL